MILAHALHIILMCHFVSAWQDIFIFISITDVCRHTVWNIQTTCQDQAVIMESIRKNVWKQKFIWSVIGTQLSKFSFKFSVFIFLILILISIYNILIPDLFFLSRPQLKEDNVFTVFVVSTRVPSNVHKIQYIYICIYMFPKICTFYHFQNFDFWLVKHFNITFFFKAHYTAFWDFWDAMFNVAFCFLSFFCWIYVPLCLQTLDASVWEVYDV